MSQQKQHGRSAAASRQQPTPTGEPGSPLPVGFTVLRTGRDEDARAALITPYCGQIKHVDFVNNEVHLVVNDLTVTLKPIPPDLRDLIAKRPQNVMLVSVDTLSRVRQATSLGSPLAH